MAARCGVAGCDREGESVQADPDGRTYDLLCPEHAEQVRAGELQMPPRRCQLSADGKTFMCGGPQ